MSDMLDKWYCIGSAEHASAVFPDAPWIVEGCREMLEGCASVVVVRYARRGKSRYTIRRAENPVSAPRAEPEKGPA